MEPCTHKKTGRPVIGGALALHCAHRRFRALLCAPALPCALVRAGTSVCSCAQRRFRTPQAIDFGIQVLIFIFAWNRLAREARDCCSLRVGGTCGSLPRESPMVSRNSCFQQQNPSEHPSDLNSLSEKIVSRNQTRTSAPGPCGQCLDSRLWRDRLDRSRSAKHRAWSEWSEWSSGRDAKQGGLVI